MRAAAITTFGGPEVLRTIEVEDPQAGPGELRVRVKAAGVQPADVALRKGWSPPGAQVTLPQIPGNEFAGVVDQVGLGVSGFAEGDEVIGFRTMESYAGLAVVPASQAVRKPAAMPWEVAGAFSASGQTAHTALEKLKAGPDDTLLIHGAAGGVGTVAVQLGRLLGATVIGTASERNHDYLRALGATPVLYGDGLVERVRDLAPNGVTAILDAHGGVAISQSIKLLEDRSRIGTIAGFMEARELGIQWISTDRSAARLQELVDLWSAGKLEIHISQVFPMGRASDAQREVEAGHVRGKVVLTMD